MKGDELDPKGLIQEAYRIDGIIIEQCRSIFLDWALSLRDRQPVDVIPALLERHGSENPDHPMTAVLKDGLAQPQKTGRRGGRRARLEG